MNLLAAVHHGHGGDGDMQCGLTWARTVTMVGRGGRGDGGEAVGVMDWLVVWHGWCASTAEARGGDGGHGGLLSEREREGETKGESERECGGEAPSLACARPRCGLAPAYGRHTTAMVYGRSTMTAAAPAGFRPASSD